MKPKIIYLDDEPQNLVGFEVVTSDEWDVTTFSDPQEALEKLSTINPCVIVSDQIMPKMSGVDFLEKAAEVVPDSVRIVITGQSAEEVIIDLIRKAKIFDYIKKPWKAEYLLSSLKKAIQFYDFEKEKKKLYQEIVDKQQEFDEINKEMNALFDVDSRIKK